MTLDAARNCAEPLTEDRLRAWHAALYPGGFLGMRRVRAGEWRDDADGPMEIVSGPPGLQRVHYIAPPAARVAGEMAGFLKWFEDARAGDPVLAAGLAHLRFLSIYPFEDGNERIARAIAEMALARSEGERFYSLTAQIRRDREAWYDILEATQKGGLDVTGWQEWFLDCLARACANARHILAPVLAKARLRETHALNPRQTRTLDRLLDGIEGGLTSSGWAKMNGCSQGHGQPGHPGSGGAWDTRARRGGRAEHGIWVGRGGAGTQCHPGRSIAEGRGPGPRAQVSGRLHWAPEQVRGDSGGVSPRAARAELPGALRRLKKNARLLEVAHRAPVPRAARAPARC